MFGVSLLIDDLMIFWNCNVLVFELFLSRQAKRSTFLNNY
jgi:hypothetical protein